MGTPINLSAAQVVLGQFAVTAEQFTSKDYALILRGILDTCLPQMKYLKGFEALTWWTVGGGTRRRFTLDLGVWHQFPEGLEEKTLCVPVWYSTGNEHENWVFLTREGAFFCWDFTKSTRKEMGPATSLVSSSSFSWLTEAELLEKLDGVRSRPFLQSLARDLVELFNKTIEERTARIDSMRGAAARAQEICRHL